uniref:Kinetochore protein SPC25 n=1 Tax=Graphocephala atropunctata TaxID=36148 RepID=A0A1B6KXS0_9HEMI
MANSNHNLKYMFKTEEMKAASESLRDLFSNLVSEIPLKVVGKSSEKHNKCMVESEQKLKEELAEVNVVYSGKCENLERLQFEFNRLKKEADEKTTQEKTIIKKKAELENQYSTLSRSKISSQDEQLKEITKLRYKALRNMTQVRFSFETSDSNRLEGLVFNMANNKTKCFTINNLSKLKPDQISDHIMAAMEAVSGTNYTDISLE